MLTLQRQKPAMGKEDVQLLEAVKTAFFITISVLTPLIFLYIGSERGFLPFEFELPLKWPMRVLAVFIVFDICFAYSVLDQWTE